MMNLKLHFKRALCRIKHDISTGQAAARREQAPEYYDNVYKSSEKYGKFYPDSEYYFLWTVILDRIRRDGLRRILEIGCGPAQLGQFLIEQGVEQYCGIDFGEVAIAFANKKQIPRARFLIADARTSDVYDSIDYNAIVCTEVLEHIEDDLLVVSRFPQGKRCICSVPNFPYKSHVRHFEDSEQVVRRYADYFEGFDVLTGLLHSLKRHWKDRQFRV